MFFFHNFSTWDKECAKSFKDSNKRPNLFNAFLKTFGRRYFSYVAVFAIDGWVVRYGMQTHLFTYKYIRVILKSKLRSYRCGKLLRNFPWLL